MKISESQERLIGNLIGQAIDNNPVECKSILTKLFNEASDASSRLPYSGIALSKQVEYRTECDRLLINKCKSIYLDVLAPSEQPFDDELLGYIIEQIDKLLLGRSKTIKQWLTGVTQNSRAMPVGEEEIDAAVEAIGINAKRELRIEKDRRDNLKDKKEPHPPSTKIPLVFISYDTNDIDIAYALDAILKRIFGNKIQIFIARRDIKAGEDSFRKMLHDNLSKCSAVIAICTKQSINSSWLWFESGAGFGNSNLIPIWAGVMPENFKVPMTIFQGKNTADKIQMYELMNRIAEIIEFNDINCDLTEDEFRNLQKVTISLKSPSVSRSIPFQGEIKSESATEISISYKKIKIESERHDYQLLIELKNKSSVPLEDYHVDVVIPSRIIENPEEQPLIVRDRSSHTESFFRFNNNDLHLRNVMPGDSSVVMAFNYYMTHDIYSNRGDLFDQLVRATLYHYGFQPLTVEKAIKDLQIF